MNLKQLLIDINDLVYVYLVMFLYILINVVNNVHVVFLHYEELVLVLLSDENGIHFVGLYRQEGEGQENVEKSEIVQGKRVK